MRFGAFGSATVTAEGLFDYTLATPLPSELEPFDAWSGNNPACKATPEDIKLVSFKPTLVDNAASEVPFTLQNTEANTFILGTQQLLYYLYVDQDATIRGDCFASKASTVTLKRGWNAVWRELSATHPRVEFRAISSDVIPSYFKWQTYVER
jgi:hypothetical protein